MIEELFSSRRVLKRIEDNPFYPWLDDLASPPQHPWLRAGARASFAMKEMALKLSRSRQGDDLDSSPLASYCSSSMACDYAEQKVGNLRSSVSHSTWHNCVLRIIAFMRSLA